MKAKRVEYVKIDNFNYLCTVINVDTLVDKNVEKYARENFQVSTYKRTSGSGGDYGRDINYHYAVYLVESSNGVITSDILSGIEDYILDSKKRINK